MKWLDLATAYKALVLKSSAVFFSNGDFFLSPENYLKSIQLQKTKVDSIFCYL